MTILTKFISTLIKSTTRIAIVEMDKREKNGKIYDTKSLLKIAQQIKNEFAKIFSPLSSH